MKPFNLEQALAGEPVILKNGNKAYVKYVMPTEYSGNYPLRGFYFQPDGTINEISWTMEGKYSFAPPDTNFSIRSMWEEPRPRVSLTLPCPLKEPQENMWLLGADDIIIETSYNKNSHSSWVIENGFALDNGRCFATKEDAQEWLDAMKASRQ